MNETTIDINPELEHDDGRSDPARAGASAGASQDAPVNPAPFVVGSSICGDPGRVCTAPPVAAPPVGLYDVEDRGYGCVYGDGDGDGAGDAATALNASSGERTP